MEQRNRDRFGIVLLVLSAAAFFSELIAVWPLLVGRLNWANWMSITFGHIALLGSMAGLYLQARKRVVIGTFEVALAAFLALMVSSMDLSLLGKR